MREFQLIDKLASQLRRKQPGVAVGPGDDCAVVRIGGKNILLTADLLIEGIHFRRDWMTSEQIGFKAMRVNLSDIAAMGGKPLFALLSVGLPPSLRGREAERIFAGLRKAGEEAGCEIVGGDTNASDRLIVNVAVVGEAPSGGFVTRGGARPGDLLYVTGSLGGSALGLAALRKKRKRGFEPDIRRHLKPPLRVSVGRFLTRLPGMHAMIDLSDGLAGDLRHILERSGVGASVEAERIPMPAGFERRARLLKADPWRLAVGGGEDYELLFAASPRVKIPPKIHGVPVAKIGRITREQGLRGLRMRGFRHF